MHTLGVFHVATVHASRPSCGSHHTDNIIGSTSTLICCGLLPPSPSKQIAEVPETQMDWTVASEGRVFMQALEREQKALERDHLHGIEIDTDRQSAIDGELKILSWCH